MGGSAIGADLARAALGDRLTKPMSTVRGYQLPAWTTPELGRPVRELLGQHRGDAGLLRGSGCARRDASRCDHRGQAGGVGARGRCAGDPAAGRAPAAGRRRLHDGVGARGRRRSRASPRACAPSSTQPRPGSSGSRRSGARTPTRTASRSGLRSGSTAPACACTGRCRPPRSRPAGSRQLNENAKLPAFAAELPEADHNEIVGWQDASSALQLHGGLPRGRRPAPARAPADRADRRADRAASGRDAAAGERRLEPAWSGCCRS